MQSNWFIRPAPRHNAPLRIICFPYAGGNASTYTSWIKWLPQNVDVVAVQPPGRSSRMLEPAYSEMDPLIQDLLQAFPDVIDRPYILFGHSLGSRVAIELMAHCQKMGLRMPIQFIASGSREPNAPPRKDNIHHLPDDEFVVKLKELNGTPEEVLQNEDLMALCMPLLRADFKLSEVYTYSSEAVFDCPISVLGGNEDEDITFADLGGWGKYFLQPPDVHMLPGDHFFIDGNNPALIQRVNQIVQNVLVQLDEKNKTEGVEGAN